MGTFNAPLRPAMQSIYDHAIPLLTLIYRKRFIDRVFSLSLVALWRSGSGFIEPPEHL